MGEEVATVGRVGHEAVEPHARAGPGQEGEDRRRAREELHVDHCVDADAADAGQRAQNVGDEVAEGVAAYRHDVLRRHDVEHVEDEPILGEHQEIDAVAADALGGEANRIGGDDRGSLLGQLQKQDPPRGLSRCRASPGVGHPSYRCESGAEQRAGVSIEAADGLVVHCIANAAITRTAPTARSAARVNLFFTGRSA